MEILVKSFYLVLYQPLFNFLVLLYEYLPGHDFGLAIIVLTLIIRLLLYPSSAKSIKTQKALNEIQPKLQEIQKKYKDDKEKQVKETLDLYKKEKINPFGGILSALIQLPILIALYQVLRKGFDPAELSVLYNFVSSPGHINAMFIGFIDLSKPNLVLAILAGVAQFIQTKITLPITKKTNDKTQDFAKIMQKQMVYFFPFLTVIILMGLPSALGLYWMVGSVFLIIEQYLLFNKTKTNKTPI
ncbi:YidC/Oxa1 family membrane protein insertase [Patescibacteria group bacterium]|nr:YidC/Oxa1 family membrane protein insertase [Patescibacteria group bacterium]